MTGQQQIAVDLPHLSQTCTAAREGAVRLRSDLREVDSQIQRGVWLGLASPSGEIDAARRALRETLEAHAYNSGRQIAVADHLSSALQLVLEYYETAEENVRLDVQRMQAILEEALPQKPVAQHWVEQ